MERLILSDMRRRIDDLDYELLRLLNKRASIVKDIAIAKKASGTPIHDVERTEQIIKRAKHYNSGPLSPESIELFFREMIKFFEDFEKSI